MVKSVPAPELKMLPRSHAREESGKKHIILVKTRWV